MNATNQFSRLLRFLQRLDAAKISYQIQYHRYDAVTILAFAPGQYWEIDFMEEGDIEIERFRSDGHIDDEPVLEELFAMWADDEPPAPEPANEDESLARK